MDTKKSIRLIGAASAACAGFTASAACAAAASPAAKGRPNVILIYVDDMGFSDVSAYGGQFAPTPNIDRIGKEGIHNVLSNAKLLPQAPQFLLKWRLRPQSKRAPARCPPLQTVRKVLARLKYPVPLYKARSGFSILTEECLTFRTTSLTSAECVFPGEVPKPIILGYSFPPALRTLQSKTSTCPATLSCRADIARTGPHRRWNPSEESVQRGSRSYPCRAEYLP